MVLGISHTTNKYTYGTADSSSVHVNSLTDIGINNGELSVTQKINVILDDVSLERGNSTKFLGVMVKTILGKITSMQYLRLSL